VYGAQAARKRKRPGGPAPKRAHVPFGELIAGMAHGLPTEVVLRETFGGCMVGCRWQFEVLDLITHARIEDGTIDPERQRGPNHPVARRILRFILRVLSRLQRHGSSISVRGKQAWWGRQFEARTLTDAQLDESIFEQECRRYEAELSGQPVPALNDSAVRLRCVPKTEALGLAGSLDISISTLGRYAHLVRLAGLLGSRQPRSDADDAVMPKAGGAYAYPVWSILTNLPAATLQRLRVWWGETPGARRKRSPRPTRSPVPASRPSPRSPTGPPVDSAAVGTAIEDSAEDMQRALAELATRLGTRSHDRHLRRDP
jgi:hypothetical protein